MTDSHLDHDLRDAELRVIQLNRRVHADPRHKARLREELLRRHQELTAESSQRAAGMLWPHIPGLKRLTLVAPPALAVAVAFSVLLLALQVSGHQNTQAAEAARLTQALTRTAPTVTEWQWTVQERNASGVSVYAYKFPLRTNQGLYVANHRVYLYSSGQWARVAPPPSATNSPGYWQWALATMVSHLTPHGFTLLPARTIRGQRTEGIHFTAIQGSTKIGTTAWVDRHSGLILRLDLVARRGAVVVERDQADYAYSRSR
jgi:hypothetical protein